MLISQELSLKPEASLLNWARELCIQLECLSRPAPGSREVPCVQKMRTLGFVNDNGEYVVQPSTCEAQLFSLITAHLSLTLGRYCLALYHDVTYGFTEKAH